MPVAISIRLVATQVVQRLQDSGHEAYFAGGCVRDTLLGLPPKDYDVATHATPEEVAKIFRSAKFVGQAFGVSLVRLKGHEVEVATFRKEWDYRDGRRPTAVVFTDAQTDAQRRDFTINGLFENPCAKSSEDRIIDFVGGQADLKNKILRAIGRPQDRLAEDYLRMLRAVRFAARFGFTIDPATAQAIADHAHRLGDISRERIGQELMAMLTPPATVGQPAKSILQAVGLLQTFKLDAPALHEPSSTAPPVVLEAMVQLLPNHVHIDYPAMLLAWMIDRSHLADIPAGIAQWSSHEGIAQVSRWREALVLSNAITHALTGTLACLTQATKWLDLSIAQKKRWMAKPDWLRAVAILRGLPSNQAMTEILQHIQADTPILTASGLSPEPFLTGNDLIALGLAPGPSFRRLLEQSYDKQLESQLTSRQAALEWLAAQCQ